MKDLKRLQINYEMITLKRFIKLNEKIEERHALNETKSYSTN